MSTRNFLLKHLFILLGVLLAGCTTSGTPGIDRFMEVDGGQLRITGVQKVDSLSQNETVTDAREGHILVVIEVTTRDEVPMAGVTDGYRSPSSGAWTLMDSDHNLYKPIASGGDLLFEVEEPAEGLVLWLGEEIALPLGGFFDEEPAVVDESLAELMAEARQQETVQTDDEDSDGESTSEEAPTATPEEETADASACLACHTDAETLESLAVEEEAGETLSSGEG